MSNNTDFNGDGRDDVLLRHDSGIITEWLGQQNGTFFSNHAVATYAIDIGWHLVGTGDFNGDGFADVLWRHDNGSADGYMFTNWLGGAGGTFFSNHEAYTDPSTWDVIGIGDFNGDGSEDLLQLSDHGELGYAPGLSDGSFHIIQVAAGLPNGWNVAGTGDFDGDADDDVLLRHDNGTITEWLASGGSFVSNHTVASYGLPPDWNVAGVGDFNGDGHDDVLLHHDSGIITEWLGGENGTFFSNHAVATYALDTAWHVEGIGDFSGDGFADVLLRHANGTVTKWLANSASQDGTFTWNSAAVYSVPAGWQIQPSGAGEWDY